MKVIAMALWDLFKNNNHTEDFDPIRDLTLAKLRPGYLVDYDAQTWRVKSYCRYDFGEGYTSEEWELDSGSETRYLEHAQEEGETQWSWSKRLPLGEIDGNLRQYIIQHDDPPDELTWDNQIYYLDESGPGYMYENGQGPAQEFIYWEFITEINESVLTIEQWGEREFEAWLSVPVQEYEFTSILPGEGGLV